MFKKNLIILEHSSKGQQGGLHVGVGSRRLHIQLCEHCNHVKAVGEGLDREENVKT
jgi:hypothetical protein